MNNIMIRRLLYALKRQWGTNVNYVQIVNSVVDDRTGSRVIERKIYNVSAVKLPQDQVRKFIQDIGYLAADKNFTYGALNDFNKITLLISRFDLPDNFNPDLNGYIHIDGKRYERQSFKDLYGEALILVAQGVEGANPYSQLIVNAYSNLQLQQQVIHGLN